MLRIEKEGLRREKEDLRREKDPMYRRFKIALIVAITFASAGWCTTVIYRRVMGNIGTVCYVCGNPRAKVYSFVMVRKWGDSERKKDVEYRFCSSHKKSRNEEVGLGSLAGVVYYLMPLGAILLGGYLFYRVSPGVLLGGVCGFFLSGVALFTIHFAHIYLRPFLVLCVTGVAMLLGTVIGMAVFERFPSLRQAEIQE